MDCRNCGRQLDDAAMVCPACGTSTGRTLAQVGGDRKSKVAAGLFGIFLGGLGIHNFYLGYKNRGMTQLLLGTIGVLIIVGPIISAMWGFIEGIKILVGTINVDAEGRPLGD